MFKMEFLMRFRSLAVAFALAAILSACGHMPVPTMVALRHFDFATFDPADLRVAVRAPDWIDARPGGARLMASLWTTGRETDKRVEAFVLTEANAVQDAAGLAEHRASGTRIVAYRIAEADFARVRSLQSQGRNMNQQNPGRSHMKLTVDVDGCRRGDLRDGPILTTTFLKPDAASGYLTFLDRVDLRRVVREAGKDLDTELPVCGKFSARAG
jgi:hypothetical protein